MGQSVGPEVLGRWSAGSGALYKRLADSLRTAIARGEIPPDSRLPAERALAQALNVSRSTVVSAYDLLYAEALVERRRGSGTWVTPRNASALRRMHRGEVWVPQAALRTIAESPGDVIPFAASTVERLPELLPSDAFQVDLPTLLSHPPYYEAPEGLLDLREAIASHYKVRGLATDPQQIIVTSGAQQALALVASAYLCGGDLALIESPTYPGAIDALAVTGARLRGVPVGSDGADVDAIERTASQGYVGLVYVIPSFQNPTGRLMPTSRRRALADVIDRLRIPTIADGSLVDLSFGVSVPRPLASFAPDAPIFSVGSLSKLFWGGLRVGWVRSPVESVATLLRLKSVADLSCSIVSQVIATHLLTQRDVVAHARRSQLLHKLQLYRSALAEELPSWTLTEPQGGVSLWVDTHADADAFAQLALRHGVALVTESGTSVDARRSTHLRLPLGLPDETIEEGLARLARAWKAFESSERRSRTRKMIV